MLPERQVLLYADFKQLPDEVKKLWYTFYPMRLARFNRYICDVEDFIPLPDGQPAAAGFKTDTFDGGLYAVGVLQSDTQWGIETDASLLYKWAGENGFILRENAHLFWISLPPPDWIAASAAGDVYPHCPRQHIANRCQGRSGYVPINQYADVVWILERDYMAVAVDSELRLYQTGMAYMNSAEAISGPVIISSAFKSALTISDLEIMEVA